MKKKVLSCVMAAFMLLSIGTGCSDTLDSSTLAEYDRDSQARAKTKEAQEQAKSAVDNLVDRINFNQDSSKGAAEFTNDELNELAKTVYNCTDNYNSELVNNGEEEFVKTKLFFEIGDTNDTDKRIKNLKEEVSKQAEKYKGYWVSITIDGDWRINVAITKSKDSSQILSSYPDSSESRNEDTNTPSASTEKATGDRPTLKGKANLYVITEKKTGYAEAAIGCNMSSSEEYLVTKYITGNDFMESLDKRFGSNGKWKKTPDSSSAYDYEFKGTTTDPSGNELTFFIAIIINKNDNTRFSGYFSHHSKTMDNVDVFKYIFT